LGVAQPIRLSVQQTVEGLLDALPHHRPKLRSHLILINF
jgi:hypothetical protein